MLTVPLSSSIIIAVFAAILVWAVCWFAILRGTWKPLSHDPLIVIVSSIGSTALVIFAFFTIYYNFRPLVISSPGGFDKNSQSLYFIIDNRSKNIGKVSVSYVAIETEQEKKDEKHVLKTRPIDFSKKKRVLTLYPGDTFIIPLSSINSQNITHHFHLLVLTETCFWGIIKRIEERVFYWDKNPESPFVLQDRYENKYKNTFDKYFQDLKERAELNTKETWLSIIDMKK